MLFNSGAEAVENAVKVARLATGRDAVVAFDHAYHGRTNLTMALTAKAMPYKTNFGPFAPEVYRMPMSYPYREENPAITGAEAAKRAITMIEKQIGGEQVAAIIIEPIQGEGGFIVPAEGFLPALAAWAKDKGIVFIADEVQSGFCRTGEWFAVNHEGVVPDIITMAKGIAGGMPLSAITGRADLLDAVHPGGLGGTYGGNPVACAAALASIGSMEQYGLNARAKHIEELALGKLRELAAEQPVIGDVRGRGAMLAIELVQAGSKEPNPELTKAVAAACLKEGVIILTCGTYGNVIRLLPPLVISDELLLDGLAGPGRGHQGQRLTSRGTWPKHKYNAAEPRTQVRGSAALTPRFTPRDFWAATARTWCRAGPRRRTRAGPAGVRVARQGRVADGFRRLGLDRAGRAVRCVGGRLLRGLVLGPRTPRPDPCPRQHSPRGCSWLSGAHGGGSARLHGVQNQRRRLSSV